MKITDLFLNINLTGRSFYSGFDNNTLKSVRISESDEKATLKLQNMSKDSLDPYSFTDQSTIEISSSSENSFKNKNVEYYGKKEFKDESSFMNVSPVLENTDRKFNDTLEKFEFMMEQGIKVKFISILKFFSLIIQLLYNIIIDCWKKQRYGFSRVYSKYSHHYKERFLKLANFQGFFSKVLDQKKPNKVTISL